MGIRILLVGLIAVTVIIGLLYTQFRVEPEVVETVEPDRKTRTVLPTEIVEISELHRLVNVEREKVGAKPLELDERLNTSAQRKADELALEGYDDTPHVNDNGVHGYEYAWEEMPECKTASENLATAPNTQYAINSWNASKPHRKALLDSDYEFTGYGVNGQYVVQHFCDID